MNQLLNLTDAPEEPIRRIMWLTGVKAKAAEELETALADAYFDARLQGQLRAAVDAGPYAMKRALALTRRINRERGGAIRWGDGLDPTST